MAIGGCIGPQMPSIVVKFIDCGDSGELPTILLVVIFGRIGAFGMMAIESLRRIFAIADLINDGRSRLYLTRADCRIARRRQFGTLGT